MLISLRKFVFACSMTKLILIRHQFAVSALDERIDKYLITFSIVFLEVSNNAALSIY